MRAGAKCSISSVVPEEGAVPGAIVIIHSFGDFLGWERRVGQFSAYPVSEKGYVHDT